MSFPTIPTNTVIPTRPQAINLLLASVAFEELGLAHLINAEAEKIQLAVGTLITRRPPIATSVNDLVRVDEAVAATLRDIIKKEMLLQFKLEDIFENETNNDDDDDNGSNGGCP